MCWAPLPQAETQVFRRAFQEEGQVLSPGPACQRQCCAHARTHVEPVCVAWEHGLRGAHVGVGARLGPSAKPQGVAPALEKLSGSDSCPPQRHPLSPNAHLAWAPQVTWALPTPVSLGP